MTDLPTRLVGTLAFATTRKLETPPAPMTVDLGVVFRKDRTVADASAFKPIDLGPFKVKDTIFGIPVELSNTMRISRVARGKGRFDPAADAGRLEIPIDLRFTHSIPLLASSDLSLTLATEGEQTAGPLKAAGRRAARSGGLTTVVLAAAGTFVGGALDGDHCTIVIEARIEPDPLPA